MGNINKIQREKNKQLKKELKETIKLKELSALKAAILSVVKDYWKSEWKDAVYKLTEQMEIKLLIKPKWIPFTNTGDYKFNNDGYLREVEFLNVPGLIYCPYRFDDDSKWLWPSYQVSAGAISVLSTSDRKTDYVLSPSSRGRSVLGLDDKLPYNL